MLDSYQAAVYNILVGNGGVAALVGDRVSQKATDSEPYPKIWLTDAVDDWSEKTGDGLEVSLEVHIGSRADGDKEANRIAEAVRDALHNVDLTLAGGAALLLCQFKGSTRLYDPDGVTRHVVVKFGLLITQE